jgi:hypothetical protein
MLFNQSVNLITVCPVHFLYDRISALAYDPVQNANGEHVKPSARVRWLLLFHRRPPITNKANTATAITITLAPVIVGAGQFGLAL